MDPTYSALYESSCSPSASYHDFNEKKHRPNANYPHVPTAMRRNERERNRVKLVNMGFTVLRQHVPNGAKNKKMSKVETLRSAVDYIKQLQKLLGETQRSHESSMLMSQCSAAAAAVASLTSPSSSTSVTSNQSLSSSSPSSCHVHVHNTLLPESTGPSSRPHSVSSLDTSELGSSERSLEVPVEDDLISFTKWFS